MKIKLIGEKRALVVDVEGELDHHTAAALRENVERKIKTTNASNIIFNFSGLKFMDSSGIGVIMGRYKTVKLLGGKMIIFGAGRQAKRILEMSGIDKIVSFCDDETSALTLIGKKH